MTTINSQDDFLRALSENPEWKATVRAQILGEELLQVPARFDVFVDQTAAFVAEIRGFVAEMRSFVAEQKRFNDQMTAFVTEMRSFVAEQKQLNEEMTAFVADQKRLHEEITAFVTEMRSFVADQKRLHEEITALAAEQKRISDRIDRRLTTLSNDVAQVKGGHARASAIQDAPGIAIDLNASLRYIRTLTRAELAKMTQDAAVGDIPTRELRSFRLADLVIEAKNGNDACLIAVEASFTASQRDASRARRNAVLLTRFTGKPAHAVIASVRNDHDAEAELAAGNVRWHELEERDMEPE